MPRTAEIDINFTLGDPDGSLIKYTDENLRELPNRGLMKPPPTLPVEIDMNQSTLRKRMKDLAKRMKKYAH